MQALSAGEAHDLSKARHRPDRMLVATRKGLTDAGARKNGGWAIAATDFPGVAVTAALRDPRDGALYAALKHGHFGPQAASLRRRRQDLDRDLPRRRFPADAAGAPVAVSDLDARSRRRRRSPAGCGSAPFRPGCSAPTIAARPGSSSRALWNVPERAEMVRRRLRRCRHPFDLARSARPRRVFVGDLVRRRVGDARRRRELDAAGEGMSPPTCRRSRPARSNVQDPHRVVRCSGRARRAVDAASQRHLPLDRRRRDLARSSSRRATTSASRWRRIRTIRKPPGSCRRSRTRCACRATASLCVHAHARRRQAAWQSAARGPAAGGRLRPRLPPRPRRRRDRHAACDGLDHRRAVDERQWRRRAGSCVNAHLPPIYAVRFA